MQEQRRLQEAARIRSTIISKKQLDTKELEKRRKPLQKLDEENEKKKRKQKQRLISVYLIYFIFKSLKIFEIQRSAGF